ncbi:kinase-like domain-containing protein [Linnemannia elongata]|nr:kinase-like domain-containing protein [Linnemannia elongata]
MSFLKNTISRFFGGVTEDYGDQQQQTVDMDSMPDLVHSTDISSSDQGMSLDNSEEEKTKPLEDHNARIPSYGNQLKQDQLQRQREHQARIEQEQLEHHLRQLEELQQQQRTAAAAAHNHHQQQQQQQQLSPGELIHSPQSPFSLGLETEQKQQEQLYRYHQLYQQQRMQEQLQQQQRQQLLQQQQQEQYSQAGGGGGQYDGPETDMPSLSFSDNSSAALSNFKSGLYGQGPSPPLPAGPGALVGGGGAGGIFDLAVAAGLGGGVDGLAGGVAVPGRAVAGFGEAGGAGGAAAPQFLDHELFLTSVLNAIAPWMDGDGQGGNRLEQFDYQSEFTQRQMLAVGGNGEIRKAYWGSRNVFVVLKSLLDTKRTRTPAENASMFDKEVEVMRLCGNHDNIVQFYGIANKHHPDYRIERFMIMQFYNHGDLYKLIHLSRHAPESPSLHERMVLALDIAVGLEHLARCGFHHGDLHPKNVLIDARPFHAGGGQAQPRYQARLTDFGLRRIRGSLAAQSSQPLGGVLQFMAPERLANKGVNRPRYDIRCDIFALGVIYWFILAGRYPFKDFATSYTPGAREGRVEGTPDWYFAVYDKAWKEDPNERQQSFDEIVSVFRHYLGTPAISPAAGSRGLAPPASSSSSASDVAVGAAVPYGYPSPPYAQVSPLMGTLDGRYGNNNNPSGTRGGSSLNPSIQGGGGGGGGGAGNLPSPALSAASAAASGASSSPSNKPARHKNHPANKNPKIPDGRQVRPRAG